MVGTKTPHRTKRPRRSTRLLLSLAEPEFATGGSGEMQDADENIDELQPLPKRPYQCDSKPRECVAMRHFDHIVGVCLEGETGKHHSTPLGIVTIPRNAAPPALAAKSSLPVLSASGENDRSDSGVFTSTQGFVTPPSSVTPAQGSSRHSVISTTTSTSSTGDGGQVLSVQGSNSAADSVSIDSGRASDTVNADENGGSGAMDYKPMSVAELRQIIRDQLTSFVPKDFSFLTKQGWPISASQEDIVSLQYVLTCDGHVRLRKGHGDVRIGVVVDTGVPLGFVKETLSCPVPKLRLKMAEELADATVLKEHSYLFLDSNGWPISLAQEEKLTVVDLIYDHTVRLSLREMEYESQPTAMMYHPSMGNAYHVKKTLAVLPPPNSHSSSSILRSTGPMSPPQMVVPMDTDSNTTPNPSAVISPKVPNPLVQSPPSSSSPAATGRLSRSMSQGSQNSLRIIQPHLSRSPSPSRANSVPIFPSVPSISEEDSGMSHSDSQDTVSLSRLGGPPEPVEGGKHFFISYVRAEASAHAKLLCRLMMERGWSVYLDVCEIKGGHDWQDSLNYAIGKCSVFVPLVTPRYGETQWTNREVKLADVLSKPIIPISFIEEWPPMCLAIQFVTLQFIPWKANASADDVLQSSQGTMEKAAEEVTEKILETYATTASQEAEMRQEGFTESAPAVMTSHPQRPFVPSLLRSDAITPKLKAFNSVAGDFTGVRQKLFGNRDKAPMVVVVSDSTQAELMSSISDAVRQESWDVFLLTLDNLNPNPSCKSEETPSRWKDHFCPKKRRQRQLQQQERQRREKILQGMNTGLSTAKCQEVAGKVKSSSLIICLLSKAYAHSIECMKLLYYCEHRKHVVLVLCENFNLPCWLRQLFHKEQPLKSSSSNFMPSLMKKVSSCMQGNVLALDDGKKTYEESLASEKVLEIRRCLPKKSCIVFVAGSVEFHSSLSPGVCSAIGAELASIDSLTLITGGYSGVGKKVAEFYTHECVKKKHPLSLYHSVAKCGDKVLQGSDAFFQPLPSSKELVCGDCQTDYEDALAKLVDIVILIEGGAGAAHEVEMCAWNDTVIIPVMATGGAAAGEFPVPQAVFDCPANTSMADWAKLNDPKVKVDEIARAVKSIIETTALTLHEDSVPVTTSSDCQNASQDMYTGSQSTQPVE